MMERGPTIVVAACIVKGKEILLALRSQPNLPEADQKWELPGGKVLIEESLHQALRREISEELDTSIEIVRLLPHVQSNTYHPPDRKVVHSVVLGFECFLSRSARAPRANDPSIAGVKWVESHRLEDLSLLPGTKQFVECLRRVDRASYGATHLYVRLEKRDPDGRHTDFWDIQTVSDLWNEANVIERHGNLVTRSTHSRLTRGIPESDLIVHVVRRLRSLARAGYLITYSDDARLSLGLTYH